MNRDEFIRSIESIYKEGVEIVKKKNDDYAKASNPWSNFSYSQVLGITIEKAILVRIMDKIARINNVLDKGGVTAVDENIDSTIIDTINYFAIMLSYIRDTKLRENNGKYTNEAKTLDKR